MAFGGVGSGAVLFWLVFAGVDWAEAICGLNWIWAIAKNRVAKRMAIVRVCFFIAWSRLSF